jgi:hypothetical protein
MYNVCTDYLIDDSSLKWIVQWTEWFLPFVLCEEYTGCVLTLRTVHKEDTSYDKEMTDPYK